MRRLDPGRFAALLALALAAFTAYLTGTLRHLADAQLSQAEAMEFYVNRHVAVHWIMQHQLRELHQQHADSALFTY